MKQNEKKKIFRFVVFNLKTAVVKRLISQYLEMKCVCLNHNDIYRVIKPDWLSNLMRDRNNTNDNN